MKKSVRLIALCAVLAALGAVMLIFGSLIEVLDLSAAIFASLLIVIAVIEGGSFWPWLTYIVTALIAWLLTPVKFAVIVYALSGYYPIIKEKLERIKLRPLSLMIKLAVFNLSLSIVLLVLRSFLPGVDISLIPGIPSVANYIVVYLAGNLVFVLYDILLTRIVTFYLFRLRDKLKFGKK